MVCHSVGSCILFPKTDEPPGESPTDQADRRIDRRVLHPGQRNRRAGSSSGYGLATGAQVVLGPSVSSAFATQVVLGPSVPISCAFGLPPATRTRTTSARTRSVSERSPSLVVDFFIYSRPFNLFECRPHGCRLPAQPIDHRGVSRRVRHPGQRNRRLHRLAGASSSYGFAGCAWTTTHVVLAPPVSISCASGLPPAPAIRTRST